MIKGFNRSKSRRKQSIKKPNFWLSFGIRFVIFLVIALGASSFLLGEIQGTANQRRYEFVYDYQDKIKEATAKLYEAEPGTELYEQRLLQLKFGLSIYQMGEADYAEVIIGDMKLATDEDRAFYVTGFFSEPEEGEPVYYEIADMSYLEPSQTFMNGRFNEARMLEKYGRIWFDPIYEYFLLDHQIFTEEDWICVYKTVYINRENHTFLPGIIQYEMLGSEKKYTVDCTPADTTGYEFIDYGDDFSNSWILFRVAPEMTSADIDYYYAPDPQIPGDYISLSPEEFADSVKVNEYPWYVGFNEPEYREFYEAVPVSTAVILSLAVLLSALIALVLATVRYQKDKTVWEIFEYRTKTTEAMAHDLKTPLAALMAYAENLEASSEDPSKVREYSKNINEKVSTMDHMIGDILSFSRSETGKIDIVKEELSIAEIINESLSALPEMKANLKGDAKIETDRKLFKQAIDNLLSNCDRYGDKESPVDITIDPENILIINKTDKTYDDADSLKKPFVKGEDSRGGKGTGLGLSIADNNLNILGFKLELVSEEGLFKAIVKFR